MSRGFVDAVHGDCIEVMKAMPDDSLDSVVCDPPYGLEFMGKEWDKLHDWQDGGSFTKPGIGARETPWPSFGGDTANPSCRTCGGRKRGAKKCACATPDWHVGGAAYTPEQQARQRNRRMQEWHEAWAREAFRVLKPGSHLIAASGSRTYHRLACAVEDAGFEVRDMLEWVYGCLDADTEILTAGGWVRYDAATAGSLAMCYDTEHDTFSWQPVEHVVTYDYDDSAFRVVGDGVDQLLSRNHRCVVKRGGRLDFQPIEAVAREREARVPVLEDVSGLLDALRLHEPDAGCSQPLLCGVPDGEAQGATPEESAGITEGSCCRVRDVREGGMEAGSVAAKGAAVLLLTEVQRRSAWGGVGKARAQGTCCVDGGQPCGVHGEDDGREQPGMERRCDVLAEAWELPCDQARALSAGVRSDGAEGRVRHGAPTDRGAAPRTLPLADGGRTPRGSQRAEQRAGEPASVRVEQGAQAVRGERFTRAVVVRVESECYRGVMWCVKVPTGAFVARRNGCMFITGNSGFPKSLDVQKALDKAAGAERPVIEQCRVWEGWGTALKPAHEPFLLARKPLTGTVAQNVQKHGVGALNINGCRVATAEGDEVSLHGRAATENGWDARWSNAQEPGQTAGQVHGRWPPNLLLSHVAPEVIDGFRCPDCGNETWTYPDGTAAGVDKIFPEGTCYGCLRAIVEPATLYVGGCKKTGTKQVHGNGHHPASSPAGSQTCGPSGHVGQEGLEERHAGTETVEAWECVEGCPVAKMDAQSGSAGAGGPASGATFGKWGTQGILGTAKGENMGPAKFYADSGGASRFFPILNFDPKFDAPFYYCAKAARKEREAGLSADGTRGNTHPTVKPVNLMRWLLRLVTPPGGTFLDPFGGSGTTGVAGILEGFNGVLIEREAEYLPIIEKRLAHARASQA